METKKGLRLIAITMIAALLLTGSSKTEAQDAPVAPGAQSPQNDQDPPSRVARLNYIDGSVSVQPAGESEWVDASMNRPLVNGDNLWADDNSRAELHIGSTAVRLGEKTGITLLESSDNAVQMRLAMGSLILNVRHLEENAYEIDTPNIAFVITQPGGYRIDVDPGDYRTEVTVWRGRVEATGGGSTYTIAASEHATFAGDDHLDYDVTRIPDRDGFDAWALQRDRQDDDSDATNYVSSDMTGYEDLNTNGDWTYNPQYGYVWSPVGLVAGWAPYRFGRWNWIAPWGWTWVADEPWGFAPYHYGRWAFTGSNWVWVPGPKAVRPVYAPALVGWVAGTGPNRSVGWFPLAPGEVFVPAYKVSSVYVNRVNTTNTIVTEAHVASIYSVALANRTSGTNNFTYANRGVDGVTIVSRDTFVNARPVAKNVLTVSSKEIALSSTTHMPSVEPSPLSRLGAGASAHQPPAAVASRVVVAVRTPQQPSPSQSLTQRSPQSSLQPSSSQSLVRQLAPSQPIARTPLQHSVTSDPAFRSFEAGSLSHGEQTKPHVWEEQGTPEPEPTQKQAEIKNTSSPQQRVHTSTKAPVPEQAKRTTQSQPQQKEEEPKYSSWHPQKAAAATSQGSHSSTSHSSSSAPPKK
jgi:hypothetical protein